MGNRFTASSCNISPTSLGQVLMVQRLDDNPLRHALPGASYSLLRQLIVLSWRFSTAWWLPLSCSRSLPLFSFHLVSLLGLKERYFLFFWHPPTSPRSNQRLFWFFPTSIFYVLCGLRGLVESREKRKETAGSGQRYLRKHI